MLFYMGLQNRAGTLLFWSRMLRRDQMLQLPMRPSELHVEAHSHSAKDSHTAQCNYCESASLQRCVDVGLEVEVVLVILIHPEPKVGNNKRLEYYQDLYRTGNVSSRSLDLFARKLPPELEVLRLRIQRI